MLFLTITPAVCRAEENEPSCQGVVVSLGIAVIELRRKKEIVVSKEMLLFCSQIEFRKEDMQ